MVILVFKSKIVICGQLFFFLWTEFHSWQAELLGPWHLVSMAVFHPCVRFILEHTPLVACLCISLCPRISLCVPWHLTPQYSHHCPDRNRVVHFQTQCVHARPKLPALPTLQGSRTADQASPSSPYESVVPLASSTQGLLLCSLGLLGRQQAGGWSPLGASWPRTGAPAQLQVRGPPWVQPVSLKDQNFVCKLLVPARSRHFSSRRRPPAGTGESRGRDPGQRCGFSSLGPELHPERGGLRA